MSAPADRTVVASAELPGPSTAQLRVAVPQVPEGLSLTQTGLAARLRATLVTSPTSLPGRPPGLSPADETGRSPRSDCVAAMDMLNDMFQRQARRLEAHLYQRAQDARAIEAAHKQAQGTAEQLRSLERYQIDQAARIRQGAKALEEMQQQMLAAKREHELVLSTCEALHEDVGQLRSKLDPGALEALQLSTDRGAPPPSVPSMADLRERASHLEKSVCAAELSASMHISATPLTSFAMSSACNPLHDLSAVTNYASRMDESPKAKGAASPAPSLAPPPPPEAPLERPQPHRRSPTDSIVLEGPPTKVARTLPQNVARTAPC